MATTKKTSSTKKSKTTKDKNREMKGGRYGPILRDYYGVIVSLIIGSLWYLLSDAESRKYARKHVFGCGLAGDLTKISDSIMKTDEDDLFT